MDDDCHGRDYALLCYSGSICNGFRLSMWRIGWYRKMRPIPLAASIHWAAIEDISNSHWIYVS